MPFLASQKNPTIVLTFRPNILTSKVIELRDGKFYFDDNEVDGEDIILIREMLEEYEFAGESEYFTTLDALYPEGLSKKEAVIALNNGQKIKHCQFISGEFVELREGSLFDEEGVELDLVDFWSRRNTPIYETGWSIYKN